MPLARSVAKYESNLPLAARLATIAATAGTIYAQYKLLLSPLVTGAALIAIGMTVISAAVRRGRYTIGPVPLPAEAEA